MVAKGATINITIKSKILANITQCNKVCKYMKI